MLIYIAGAGAMGCRFGYQLQRSGEDVILLDNWGEHVDAIQKNGLQVTGDETLSVQIPIMYPQDATKPADLIILFTKAMQLENMLQSIQQIIGQNTKVLCLLNGLGHEEIIKKYVSADQIIMGVTVWTAGLPKPGVVHLQGVGTIDLQSLTKDGESQSRVIADILSKAALNATYSDNVLPDIWRKACVNGTMNSLCALLDGTIGQVFAQAEIVDAVKTIIDEFVAVATAEGVAMDKQAIIEYVMAVSKKAAHHYPSMHQDLVQNKRYTEIDYINGAVVKKGEKLGIETPYCRLITQLIHAKEKMIIV